MVYLNSVVNEVVGESIFEFIKYNSPTHGYPSGITKELNRLQLARRRRGSMFLSGKKYKKSCESQGRDHVDMIVG